MKTSLAHLPQNKIDELTKIVSAIKETSNHVEMIILFGSYAKGTYKEAKDLKEGRKTGHVSDYDILVVTKKKEDCDDFLLWHGDEKLNLSTHTRVIAHDIESVNIYLAEGQYFFTDIKKEGIVLFDSGKFQLADKRKLTSQEEQKIARKYFDHWFKIAEGFYMGYQHFLERENDKTVLALAAFNLHQAAEHAYKAILLVFTNYNPNEHYLGVLSRMTHKYHPELKNLFSTTARKDKDRFELLDYAYIGGRYDPEFKILKSDLTLLASDVQKLLQLTKKICEERIRNLVK